MRLGMRKRLFRHQLLYVLASGVLVVAVAAGIYGYLTMRDQVADLDADLAALDARLAAVVAERDALDREITAAPPIPPPYSWETTRIVCSPSGFVRFTDETGVEDDFGFDLDKYRVAAWIITVESDPSAVGDRRGAAFWMRECAAALGWSIP